MLLAFGNGVIWHRALGEPINEMHEMVAMSKSNIFFTIMPFKCVINEVSIAKVEINLIKSDSF
jgi:hypothetical protein